MKAVLPPPLERIATTVFFQLTLPQLAGVGVASLPIGHLLLVSTGPPLLRDAGAAALASVTGVVLFARPDQRTISSWILLLFRYLRAPRTLHLQSGDNRE